MRRCVVPRLLLCLLCPECRCRKGDGHGRAWVHRGACLRPMRRAGNSGPLAGLVACVARARGAREGQIPLINQAACNRGRDRRCWCRRCGHRRRQRGARERTLTQQRSRQQRTQDSSSACFQPAAGGWLLYNGSTHLAVRSLKSPRHALDANCPFGGPRRLHRTALGGGLEHLASGGTRLQESPGRTLSPRTPGRLKAERCDE